MRASKHDMASLHLFFSLSQVSLSPSPPSHPYLSPLIQACAHIVDDNCMHVECLCTPRHVLVDACGVTVLMFDHLNIEDTSSDTPSLPHAYDLTCRCSCTARTRVQPCWCGWVRVLEIRWKSGFCRRRCQPRTRDAQCTCSWTWVQP